MKSIKNLLIAYISIKICYALNLKKLSSLTSEYDYDENLDDDFSDDESYEEVKNYPKIKKQKIDDILDNIAKENIFDSSDDHTLENSSTNKSTKKMKKKKKKKQSSIVITHNSAPNYYKKKIYAGVDRESRINFKYFEMYEKIIVLIILIVITLLCLIYFVRLFERSCCSFNWYDKKEKSTEKIISEINDLEINYDCTTSFNYYDSIDNLQKIKSLKI